jgi:hypothetical protein
MARKRKLLSAAIGVSLGLYLASHLILPHDPPVPRGVLDCAQVEQLWEQEGGAPTAAFMAAEIAEAESSGHEDATDRDSNGTVDRGLFQVNSAHGSLSTYNVDANVRAAVYLSDDGENWEPWRTYVTGAYIGQCLGKGKES